jgi:hypothetical protein
MCVSVLESKKINKNKHGTSERTINATNFLIAAEKIIFGFPLLYHGNKKNGVTELIDREGKRRRAHRRREGEEGGAIEN